MFVFTRTHIWAIEYRLVFLLVVVGPVVVVLVACDVLLNFFVAVIRFYASTLCTRDKNIFVSIVSCLVYATF